MPLMKREYSMISKKSLPSSLEASQMPMYKGLMAREGDSFTLPSPSLVWRIRVSEWKREGEVRVNESPSRVNYPLYKDLLNEKGSKGGRLVIRGRFR